MRPSCEGSAAYSPIGPVVDAESDGRPSFLVVIPLYGMRPEESRAYRSLVAARCRLLGGECALRILLYDNTPGGDRRDAPEVAEDVFYCAFGRNDGLAAAFNFALNLALCNRHDWIVTLDQDTELPVDFLTRIASMPRTLQNQPSVAAIVPQIVGDGRLLSPNWFWGGAIPRWFPRGYAGMPAEPTFAFNSGSILRVSALRQIRGYSPMFWLDHSDSYLYRQLHLHGKSVFVAGDIVLNHHFSMLDKEKRMTIDRYHNVLVAESAFWDTSMNLLAGWERTARLVCRWMKQVLGGDSREFRVETGRAIKRRLLMSRRSRIASYVREVEERHPAQTAQVAPSIPTKLSVCMATCNGERFVGQQLSSILAQLGAEDEVIVVDDASEDATAARIVAFHDSRIRLIRHKSREGVVRSFEEAVRSASGDVVFFSDQDDIWAAEKVSRVVEALVADPQVFVVVTNFKTIDEDGEVSVDSKTSTRRVFDHRFIPNFVSNRFQGSTMAIRSELIRAILPFPEGCHVFHDAWIGMRAAMIGAKCEYLDEELLFYRRHGGNLSGRLTPMGKILKRVRLFVALGARWLRDKGAGPDMNPRYSRSTGPR